MSAWKSMTVRFYTHSTKKHTEGVALIDSGATKNFMSLDYAWWLRLPVKCLEKLRQLFNINGTENKAEALQFYTDVSLQTGTQCTNDHFFLSDLDSNKAIFSYPWFASTQPKINWAREWIDSSQLSIILQSPDTQKAQFMSWDKRTVIKCTVGRIIVNWVEIWPTAWEAV